jgi:hypothetical protein
LIGKSNQLLATCNGQPDPSECLSTEATLCGTIRFGGNVTDVCPVLCNSCLAINTPGIDGPPEANSTDDPDVDPSTTTSTSSRSSGVIVGIVAGVLGLLGGVGIAFAIGCRTKQQNGLPRNYERDRPPAQPPAPTVQPTVNPYGALPGIDNNFYDDYVYASAETVSNPMFLGGGGICGEAAAAAGTNVEGVYVEADPNQPAIYDNDKDSATTAGIHRGNPQQC